MPDLEYARYRHLPFFGTLPPGNIHYGFGYTGNGVAPSYSGGRILAVMALEREDRCTALPMAQMEPRRFPVEPFKSIGAQLIRAAILRKDDAEELDREASAAANFVARLPRRMGPPGSLNPALDDPDERVENESVADELRS